jgi:crotonobetainyl-CoA:carnitine CoA-transferase CaiB-like acyl-CoA transferase
MKKLPLEGVRIADLTAVWAGPYATRLLGDLGAEVIKVESPQHPDLLRALGFMPPGTPNAWNRAAYFNHNNRNKYGCALDLASELGRETFLRLVPRCDIVIENFRADVLDTLRLGYDELRKVREDIILISMPGHGKDGPERDYVAYGTNVEQLAGLVSLSGYIGGPPQKSGISYGDPVAGTLAAGAAIMALLARRRTGKGQYVELSQREGLTSLIGEQVLGYNISGKLPERIGNRHPFYAPHGCYPAAGNDQWVTIACRDDDEFGVLCSVMDRPELAEDERFATAAARHAHQDELDTEIAAWTREHDREEIFHLLAEDGVPAAPVWNYADLYANEHLRERGFFEQVWHRDAGTWDMERPVYRFANRPTQIRMNAPGFAEHNDYVFRDLIGLSADEVAKLEETGVMARIPNMSSHQ